MSTDEKWFDDLRDSLGVAGPRALDCPWRDDPEGSSCPTREELEAWIGDELPPQESRRLGTLLEGCPACQARMVALSEGLSTPPVEAILGQAHITWVVVLPQGEADARWRMAERLQVDHGAVVDVEPEGPRLIARVTAGTGSLEPGLPLDRERLNRLIDHLRGELSLRHPAARVAVTAGPGPAAAGLLSTSERRALSGALADGGPGVWVDDSLVPLLYPRVRRSVEGQAEGGWHRLAAPRELARPAAAEVALRPTPPRAPGWTSLFRRRAEASGPLEAYRGASARSPARSLRPLLLAAAVLLVLVALSWLLLGCGGSPSEPYLSAHVAPVADTHGERLEVRVEVEKTCSLYVLRRVGADVTLEYQSSAPTLPPSERGSADSRTLDTSVALPEHGEEVQLLLLAVRPSLPSSPEEVATLLGHHMRDRCGAERCAGLDRSAAAAALLALLPTELEGEVAAVASAVYVYVPGQASAPAQAAATPSVPEEENPPR